MLRSEMFYSEDHFANYYNESKSRIDIDQKSHFIRFFFFLLNEFASVPWITSVNYFKIKQVQETKSSMSIPGDSIL